MDRSQRIELLMQVLQGKAPKSILKTNKVVCFIGGDPENRFKINGNNATFGDVFALLNEDPTFETEVIRL